MALKSLFYKSLSKDLVFYYIQLRLAVWKEERTSTVCVRMHYLCACVQSLQ